MKKFILFFIFLISVFTTFGQTDYLPVKKLLVTSNMRPPSDTIGSPLWVGEVRQLVQGDSAQIFIAISKTAPKKWWKISSSSISPTGTIDSTNTFILGKGTDTDPLRLDTASSALQSWITSLGGGIADSLKFLVAAYIDSVITANAATLLFDSLGTGEAAVISRNDTLFTRLFQDTSYVTWDTATDGSIRVAIDTATLFPAIRATVSGGGGGTPGGSDTQVQFNDASAFGGDAGFTYNKTSNTATLDSIYLGKKIRLGNPPVDGFYNADVSIAFDGNSTSAGLSIYNSSGQRIMSILENGAFQFPLIFSNFNSNGLTLVGDVTKVFDANAISGGRTPVWRYQSSTLTSNGTQYFFEQIPTFAPTSDVAGKNLFAVHRIAPTINQTGSNDNITTGLLFAPTLTSAPNWINIISTTTPTQFGRIRTNESATVTTTDDTQTTGATIAIDTAGHIVEVDWSIKGEDGSGNIAIYKRLVRVKNVAGTLTILGTPDAIGTDYEDAGISGASITFDVSGTSLRCRVTGISATTINWRTVHERRHL